MYDKEVAKAEDLNENLITSPCPQSCVNDISIQAGSSDATVTNANAATNLDRGDSKNWFDWTALLRKSEYFIRRKRSRRSRSLELKGPAPVVPPFTREKHDYPPIFSEIDLNETETSTSLLSAIRDEVEHYAKTGSIPRSNVNPLYHRVHLDIFQQLKLAFTTVFIFPVRSVLVLIALSVAWFVAYLGTARLTPEAIASKPFPRWKRVCLWFVSKVFMRIAFFLAGFHWAQIRGKRATTAEAPILVVAPHSSVFDAYLVVLMGGPSVVARSDVHRMPLIGNMVDLTQAIYVGRDDASSRQSSVQQITRRARSKGEWPQIFIFPEGTCGNRTALLKFKLGAFLPGVPVQPVLVRWPNQTDSITWTFDGIPPWKNFILAFSQFTNHLQIEFLPVYVPSKEEQNNAQLYASNVQKLMGQVLNIPPTDFTFEDGTHLLEMRSTELPLQLRTLKNLRNQASQPLLLHELDLLQNFTQPSTTSSSPWLMSAKKLQEVSNFDPAISQKIMAIYGNGENLDFRLYLVHICLIHSGVSVDKIIRLVHALYEISSLNETAAILAIIYQILLIPLEKLQNWTAQLGNVPNDLPIFRSTFVKLFQFAKTFGSE